MERIEVIQKFEVKEVINMSTIVKTDQLTKTKIGTKRSAIQIKSTISFELKRNMKNLFIMLVTFTLIYGLFLTINLIQEGRGLESPEDPIEYILSYLSLIEFLIMLVAVTFGGSIIAEDYDKQTGNLIFPKIPKERLLFGRLIARYLLTITSIVFYYLLVMITTVIKYQELPVETWSSLGFAIFYAFLVLAMVTFFSSFMNSTNSAIISSILMILIVFNLTHNMLMFTGVEIEPFFILTYYGSIITSILDMPESRFAEKVLGRPGGNGATYFSWLTPSVPGAIIGIVVYATILLGLAHILFKIRQQKQ